MKGSSNPVVALAGRALAAAGLPDPVVQVQSLGGGCINNACRVETAGAAFLLKWNAHAPPGLFRAEAAGLELLQQAAAVRVPQVLAVADPAEQPAFLLMEWIATTGRTADRTLQERLGTQLAALHQAPVVHPGMYGLDHDNYIGSTPQLNGWESDWVRFFAEHRLRPQAELAARNGLLPAARRRRLDQMIERLPTWLAAVERRPALLHGDLWSGNLLAAADATPVLIDPAVYYGDREAEIAYTELFGGFAPAFYAAYHAAWPLEPGYADRRDIYNLYHLINHLNLFGASYGAAVDAILQRYSGA